MRRRARPACSEPADRAQRASARAPDRTTARTVQRQDRHGDGTRSRHEAQPAAAHAAARRPPAPRRQGSTMPPGALLRSRRNASGRPDPPHDPRTNIEGGGYALPVERPAGDATATAVERREDYDELLLLGDLTLAEFLRHLARSGGTILEEDGLLLFGG